MNDLPDSIEELIQELVKAKQVIEYNPPPVGGYTLHRDPDIGNYSPAGDADREREQAHLRWWLAMKRQSDLFQALAAKGSLTIPALVAALEDSGAGTRIAAANVLSHIADERAVAPLLRMLAEDTDPRARMWAAEALCGIAEKRAIVPLTGPLKAALTPLIHALSDPDPHVRSSAAGALGQLRDSQAMLALIQALNDPDSMVRCIAACALVGLEDDRAVDPLIALLRDHHETTREAAINALYDLGATQAIPALRWVAEHDTGATQDGPLSRQAAATVEHLVRLQQDRGSKT